MSEESHFYFDEDTTDDCLDKPELRYGPNGTPLVIRSEQEQKDAGDWPPMKPPPLSEG